MCKLPFTTIVSENVCAYDPLRLKNVQVMEKSVGSRPNGAKIYVLYKLTDFQFNAHTYTHDTCIHEIYTCDIRNA